MVAQPERGCNQGKTPKKKGQTIFHRLPNYTYYKAYSAFSTASFPHIGNRTHKADHVPQVSPIRSNLHR